MYLIIHQTNTTQTLKGPTVKDPFATYFASTDSLVQLSSSGSVSFLSYNADSTAANSAASWTAIDKLPVALAPSSASASGTATSTGTGTGKAGGTGTARGAAATGNSEANAASSRSVGWSMGGALTLAVVSLLL